MSKFGWSLPPGCSHRDIDEAMGALAICETCGNSADDCICPECPKCGEAGNPYCYEQGHLVATHEQLVGQSKRYIADLEAQLDGARYALEVLEAKKENS